MIRVYSCGFATRVSRLILPTGVWLISDRLYCAFHHPSASLVPGAVMVEGVNPLVPKTNAIGDRPLTGRTEPGAGNFAGRCEEMAGGKFRSPTKYVNFQSNFAFSEVLPLRCNSRLPLD